DSAETSARLNTLPDTIAFEVSDFRARPPQAADLVLANLTGGMLTSAAGAIAALVRPQGRLILSGFDHTEVASVVAAFPSFSEQRRLSEDNWIALEFAAHSRMPEAAP